MINDGTEDLLTWTARRFNVHYHILSYVKGEGEERYVSPRINAIATALRQNGLEVRHAALCYEKVGRGGKADWWNRNGRHAIIDDSPEIIDKYESRPFCSTGRSLVGLHSWRWCHPPWSPPQLALLSPVSPFSLCSLPWPAGWSGWWPAHEDYQGSW